MKYICTLIYSSADTFDISDSGVVYILEDFYVNSSCSPLYNLKLILGVERFILILEITNILR